MFDGEDLVDRMVGRSREIASLQALFLTDVVAVVDASPSVEFAPMEVGAALALTRLSAAAQVDLAYAVVVRLPAVHAALGRGDIDLVRARLFVDAVACVDLPTARAVCDAALPAAGGLTTGQLRARLAKLVIAVDPDAAAARHRLRVRGRRAVVEPGPDGTADFCLYDLPADRAVAAANHVHALARARKQAGDRRTMDQLRADTAVELLLGRAAPGGGGGGGGVEIVATLQTLIGLAGDPGHLNGFGPVIADIARQVAASQQRGPWTFTIHDTVTGIVHTGLTRRRPGAGLARHLRQRDRTCRAKGCRVPASRADIDHTIAVEDGGLTEHGNLGCLCRWHHRAKHSGGWTLRQTTPGHFEWRSPLGKTYRVDPEPPP